MQNFNKEYNHSPIVQILYCLMYLSRVLQLIKVRPGTAVSGARHLAVQPVPVVGNTSIHSVFASLSTAVSEAHIANQDMLSSLLVSQRTSGVALHSITLSKHDVDICCMTYLAAVLPLLPAGTDHALSDAGAHGVDTGGVVHHGDGDLQQHIRPGSSEAGGSPA